MGHFKQRVPAYFTGFEMEEADYSSMEELLSISSVARWNTDKLDRFSYTVLESLHSAENYLMAELKDGKFFAIGYITDPMGLPSWSPRERA